MKLTQRISGNNEPDCSRFWHEMDFNEKKMENSGRWEDSLCVAIQNAKIYISQKSFYISGRDDFGTRSAEKMGSAYDFVLRSAF